MLAILLMVITACALHYSPQEVAASLPATPVQTTEQHLLSALFLTKLQAAAADFYSSYLTNAPGVFEYDVAVVRTEAAANGGYRITFSLSPFVGAHIDVGRDEATFEVSISGEVQLVQYNHLESFPLPEPLTGLLKQPLPSPSAKAN